jgi:hypothetical protein
MRTKSTPDTTSLLINGFKPLSRKDVEDFFIMLEEMGLQYIPNRMGMYEPLRISYSLDEAVKLWINSNPKENKYNLVMFKSNDSHGEIGWSSNRNKNNISLYLKTEIVTSTKGSEQFINLAKKLFLLTGSIYGYACHISNTIYTPGHNFMDCLGGIRWINLFGPDYVKMFGRERLLSAPCIVEEFAENCFMLLLSKEPKRKDDELLALEKQIEKHLGEDAFYHEPPPNKPPTTLEELRASANKKDPYKYRAPDFSEYFKGVTLKKIAGGMILVQNPDGSFTEHKTK